MELIDSISVWHGGVEHQVMLFIGDIANLPKKESVDALVVSAFPDDYDPTPTSVIGALSKAGLSVTELAQNSEEPTKR